MLDETATAETVRTSVMPPAAGLTPSAHFALVVIEGPDAGRRVDIDAATQGPVLVGQASSCVLQLADPRASRRHASFDVVERRLRVSDLGSTNGTFVNGVCVVEALLVGGEVVRLGDTTLRVELLAPAALIAISPEARFGRLLGGSVEMRRLRPLLQRLAATTVPVVIEGETGTGKELLAESVHELGPRAGGPFVVFDCTAVAPSLAESELFGHERGAFTGAVVARRGVFEQAHGGTLLIDEIGDLPAALQPKLLRALERSEVRRVGSERTLRVDVRILCATRRDLDAEVQAGRFRDDLFHRLAVARVELPPLRRRRGDVSLLARELWTRMGGREVDLDDGLLGRWESYSWPGNVRELRNAVARRFELGDAMSLQTERRQATAAESPLAAPGEGVLEQIVSSGLPFPEARRRAIDELELRYVARVLAENEGNVSRAAAASGIARRQFQRVKGRAAK